MKYIVANWLTDEVIKMFDFEEERDQWLTENINRFSDGCYLDDGTKISICETLC